MIELDFGQSDTGRFHLPTFLEILEADGDLR